MLESLITSKARIKLLLKFFLNPGIRAYLRELATEFHDSSNSIRVELNSLVKAKLLKTKQEGRNIFYSADTTHPLFPEIHNICKKITGIDYIHRYISSFGDVHAAYVTGDYANGIDSGIIDLVLVGNLDVEHVLKAVIKGEKILERKIRTLTLKHDEFARMRPKLEDDSLLLVWGGQDKEGVSEQKLTGTDGS